MNSTTTKLTAVFTAALAAIALISSAQAATSIQGTQWYFIEADSTTVPTNSKASLLLSHGTLSGSTGVNRMTGSYSLANGVFKAGPVATTRMAGPPDAMAVEVAVLSAIKNATAYKLENGVFHLLSGSQTVARLATQEGKRRLAAQARQLIGTDWYLVELDGIPVSVSQSGKSPRIHFKSDGRASGTGGVNSISGSYSVKNGVISFGNFISTMMAGPPEDMTVESGFLKLLSGNVRYSITGAVLTLNGNDHTAKLEAR